MLSAVDTLKTVIIKIKVKIIITANKVPAFELRVFFAIFETPSALFLTDAIKLTKSCIAPIKTAPRETHKTTGNHPK